MKMTKSEVISALSNQPVWDPDIGSQISEVISSPPFFIMNSAQCVGCAGVEFYLGRNYEPMAFRPVANPPVPSTVDMLRQFRLLVSDFDRLLVAQSSICTRAERNLWLCAEPDNPCDIYVDQVAKAIAAQLGLRYVDAFELHAMSLDWDELPKHNEFEFVARLQYSEPNAFSLLFYEWA